MLDLTLKVKTYQFNGKNYLQTLGAALGTKMASLLAHRESQGVAVLILFGLESIEVFITL